MRALLFLLLAAGAAAAQTPPAPTGCRPMPECLIINGPGPGDNEGGLGGMLRGVVRDPPPAAMAPPPAMGSGTIGGAVGGLLGPAPSERPAQPSR
ncbi:hypothetical protein [Falsiroseomonas oryziterrae]|uniref:hypothetical protein n=1 Tax=Falsiroseomonas oryziterrae TaxID=2911368 RepID=UPI001F194470|nr:hypothetical protein [Roseomonas sp. NPKOSM-4]